MPFTVTPDPIVAQGVLRDVYLEGTGTAWDDATTTVTYTTMAGGWIAFRDVSRSVIDPTHLTIHLSLDPASLGTLTITVDGESAGVQVVSWTPTRRSLTACRRVLAERLNSLTLVTTTATSTDNLTLVSTDLLLGLSDTNRYLNEWVYPWNGTYAAQTRKVPNQALQPDGGILKVVGGWSGPIQQGTQFEIHKRLPPTSMDGYTGLRECLNSALRELWVLDRLAVAAITSQPSYDLGTLFAGLGDWLDPQAIVELYGPQIAAGLNIIPWGGFDAVQDAESIQLQVAPGLTTGQTATLEITRPGNTYLKMGGVWTDNQDGFIVDSDECLFRPEVLAEVALVYAYSALARISSGAEKAEWQAEYQNQRRRVDGWKATTLPHPPQRMSSQRPVTAGWWWGGYSKDGWS